MLTVLKRQTKPLSVLSDYLSWRAWWFWLWLFPLLVRLGRETRQSCVLFIWDQNQCRWKETPWSLSLMFTCCWISLLLAVLPPLRTAECRFDICWGCQCHRGPCVTDGRHRLFSATFRAAAVRNAAKSNQLQLATRVSPQPGTLCQSVTSTGVLWKKRNALDILL